MPEPGKIEELTESLKKYIITIYELNKLEAVEHMAEISSSMISHFIVGLAEAMFVLILSIGGCMYLSARLGDNYTGFFIVAGFYFLLALILIIVRKKLIVRRIREKIIRKIFRTRTIAEHINDKKQ